MSVEVFARLTPVFRRARLVYLQGWGEPLLNPHFFEMARLAHGCGCHVGVTTNGMLLTPEKAALMVEAGVHFVALSMAGADEAQDSIRVGTTLARVLEAIDALAAAKERAGSKVPVINVAYMALRSRLEDVLKLPALLADRGVAEVIVSTLDYVADPALTHEAIQPTSQDEEDRLRSLLSRAAEEGQRRGIRVHSRVPAWDQRLGPCTENVARAAVVSAAGDVFPCVFMNLPKLHREPGVSSDGGPAGFGNIRELPFSDIWRSKAYRKFRRAHERGAYPSSCPGCRKLMLASE
jgi:MoaA/NifB/PqqE/SkfB family radical SAM enzyme